MSERPGTMAERTDPAHPVPGPGGDAPRPRGAPLTRGPHEDWDSPDTRGSDGGVHAAPATPTPSSPTPSSLAPGLSRDELVSLWSAHRRWVAAIVLAYKPWWTDADDILQEVALAIVRKGHTVRDAQAFKGWLRTVAINAARLAARTSDPPVATPDGTPRVRPAASAAPLECVIEDDAGRRITRLASQLPDGYREPLLLKAVDNLSYRQIGKLMGLPETTIETRIARARKMLRELAAQKGLDGDA